MSLRLSRLRLYMFLNSSPPFLSVSLSIIDLFKVFSVSRVIIFIESFRFLYLSSSYGKRSCVINVATLVTKQLHPAIGTPIAVPNQLIHSELPNFTPTTLIKISKLIL